MSGESQPFAPVNAQGEECKVVNTSGAKVREKLIQLWSEGDKRVLKMTVNAYILNLVIATSRQIRCLCIWGVSHHE